MPSEKSTITWFAEEDEKPWKSAPEKSSEEELTVKRKVTKFPATTSTWIRRRK